MESRTLNQGEKSERLVYFDAIASYKPSTPARLFVQFFRDSLHVLYHVQLKTAKWKCLSQKDRGKVSTNYCVSNHHYGVKYDVLHFFNSYSWWEFKLMKTIEDI
jgi:hypothetical protein